MSSLISNTSTVACHECGVLHQFQPIPQGTKASCQRCGSTLYRYNPRWMAQSFALWLSLVLLFILTNSFTLFSVKAQGMVQDLTLVKAVGAFWQSDLYALSLLIALNLLIFPLLEMIVILWVLLTLRFQWQPSSALMLFRWFREVKPWGMLEVFMLGSLVAVTKLGDIATLIVGTAFWAFAAQIIVGATLHSVFEPFWVWRSLGALQKATP